MQYSEVTINDPNRIKRFLQRKRFEDALSLLPTDAQTSEILDFGAGDGELASRLLGKGYDCQVTCYEPSPDMRNQAAEKLKTHSSKCQIVRALDGISDGVFDVVYCLEVFEHLPKKEMDQALLDIARVLKPAGMLIVGVPNELYLAALYKGIFRMFRRYGEYDASPYNIWKSVLGSPPTSRPIGEISKGVSYHFHHLGFDFRCFAAKLKGTFNVRTVCSPFRLLPKSISPELYFVATRSDILKE
tara:strand:- start:2097 stop:2828 length:732 start_codon:yes stop_codon:yes gene_type:complete